MKYTVITAKEGLALIDSVNTMLGQGWRPQGGVAWDPKGQQFLQALVSE